MLAISRLRVAATIGLTVLGLAAVRPAAADNFRVENAVFAENQPQPESRSTTIFSDRLVYDFMEQPPEAIVLDQTAGRFTLLDMGRHVRTELPIKDVAAFSETLKKTALRHKDDPLLMLKGEQLLMFMAEPSFQEQYDGTTNRLTLTSPGLTYQLQLLPYDKGSVVVQYHDFSDWYVRLNVLLNPGSRPPQARLAVNEAVARHRAVAREVRLSIVNQKGSGSRQTMLRSQHEFSPELTAADLERVKKAREHMSSFTYVTFPQYRRQ